MAVSLRPSAVSSLTLALSRRERGLNGGELAAECGQLPHPNPLPEGEEIEWR